MALYINYPDKQSEGLIEYINNTKTKLSKISCEIVTKDLRQWWDNKRQDNAGEGESQTDMF